MTKKIENFINLELEKLFDSLLSTQNLRLQVGMFFGTTNLTGLGLSFSIGKGSIIIISAFTMLLFIFADIVIVRTIYGFYYHALRILKNELKYSEETIFDMFALFLRENKILKIHNIVKIDKQPERFKQLRNLPYYAPTIMGFWAPLLTFFIEIALGIYLIKFEGWKLY